MKLESALGNQPSPQKQFKPIDAFYVGDAYVQPSLNRITLDEKVSQVEPKVMDALQMLSARPGHVVHRDAMIDQVWQQTSGDEYLLNRAISELRKIFKDKAQNPNYIETIRKTGYRLIAPIKPANQATLVAKIQPTQKGGTSKAKILAPILEYSNGFTQLVSGKYSFAVITSSTLALLSCIFIFQSFHSGDNKKATPNYQVYPVTSRPGREYEPSLSPDGSQVAYVADNGLSQTTNVYVKMLDGEQTLKLTHDNRQVRFPHWTPDGQRIFYAQLSPGDGLKILSVSPLGGAAQVIYSDIKAHELYSFSISPDGEQLAFSKRQSRNTPFQIWLLNIKDGNSQQITFPKAGTMGDVDPIFTPDGNSLAFVRSRDIVTKDIYLLSLSGSSLKQLTFDNRKINGITSSPDGSRLLFTSTRTGLYRLWSIDWNGNNLTPFSLGLETVQQPVTSSGIDAIMFEEWKHQAQLKTLDLANKTLSPLENIGMSSRWDSNPAISPDGKTIAFTSNRRGPHGIWLSELHHSSIYEWANLNNAFIDNAAWSPNGELLAFNASPNGYSEVYLKNKDTATLEVLALGTSDNQNPSWSRDGKWIYFESNRTGSWQLYAWNMETETETQLNIPLGKRPIESLDGNWILYTIPGQEGIWRCHKIHCLTQNNHSPQPSNTIDTSEQLVIELKTQDAINWVPSQDGIYFVKRLHGLPPRFAFFNYAKNESQDLFILNEGFVGLGLAVTPNEEKLIFSELIQQNVDIHIARSL